MSGSGSRPPFLTGSLADYPRQPRRQAKSSTFSHFTIGPSRKGWMDEPEDVEAKEPDIEDPMNRAFELVRAGCTKPRNTDPGADFQDMTPSGVLLQLRT